MLYTGGEHWGGGEWDTGAWVERGEVEYGERTRAARHGRVNARRTRVDRLSAGHTCRGLAGTGASCR